MTETYYIKARRMERAGLVSVRVGAVRVDEKTAAYWVPADVAERIRRMCEKAEAERRTE